MEIPCSDGEMQSWVFNRLPLSAKQKWDLVQELKEEKNMSAEEIAERNRQQIQDDLEQIELYKAREAAKLEELNAPLPELVEVDTRTQRD